jgi:release factor glutamine methyltransferase
VLDQCGELSSSTNSTIRCLDLGTGTGAIALALASELPTWEIEALDYNHDAVALAQENAKNNELNQVTIYQSDWFSEVDKAKKIDVIVSNPPYIDSEDHHLNEGDVRFEPSSALVADEKGLADIIHIATQAKNYLAPQGYLFFEHGFDQAVAVQQILQRLGYQQPHTAQDLSGNDRITWARLQ